MKWRRLMFGSVALFGTLFLITTMCFGATMAINFEGSSLLASVASDNGRTDVEGIEAFTLWFGVGDDFLFSNLALGSAIPTTGTLGWEIDSQSVVDDAGFGKVFKVGAYDQDGLYLSDPHYMTDGVIAMFDFSGTLGDLKVVQFDPGDGSNLFPDIVETKSSGVESANFGSAAVPIPSTLLLLGGGLVGLVGLKRRNRA